jgi:hypothetical protein
MNRSGVSVLKLLLFAAALTLGYCRAWADDIGPRQALSGGLFSPCLPAARQIGPGPYAYGYDGRVWDFAIPITGSTLIGPAAHFGELTYTFSSMDKQLLGAGLTLTYDGKLKYSTWDGVQAHVNVLSGPRVATLMQDKFVAQLAAFFLLVITEDGKVGVHQIDSRFQTVSDLHVLSGPLVTSVSVAKYVVTITLPLDRLLVITEDGKVWAYDIDIVRQTISAGHLLTGPPVANAPGDQFVLSYQDSVVTRLVIVNCAGNVFSHKLTFGTGGGNTGGGGTGGGGTGGGNTGGGNTGGGNTGGGGTPTSTPVQLVSAVVRDQEGRITGELWSGDSYQLHIELNHAGSQATPVRIAHVQLSGTGGLGGAGAVEPTNIVIPPGSHDITVTGLVIGELDEESVVDMLFQIDFTTEVLHWNLTIHP